MFDENFYADLQREEEAQELAINGPRIPEWDDGDDARAYQEEREADQVEEHFTSERY